MPALGDHLKVEIDEVRQPARAYVLDIATSAKQSQKVRSATKTNNGFKT